jgi:hypothetical protein
MCFSSNSGNGTLYECSNQGFCNRTTGICDCLSYFSSSNKQLSYYTSSSDGYGNLGSMANCGYVARTLPACYIDGIDICGHRGVCSNSSNTCTCHDGYHGLSCEIASCPTGPAFFDEPVSSTVAHQTAICSNNGHCNKRTGQCSCRDGFFGEACQYKNCPRHRQSSVPCNGRGWCVSMSAYASLYGYSYGESSNNYSNPTTWDAYLWHECVCSAKFSAGFTNANPNYPTIAAK